MDNKIFYVYADYTMEDIQHIFYIGKGNKNRFKSLKRPIKNGISKHDAIMKKYGIERKNLFQTENEKEAFNKEIELIAFYKLNMYKHPENHYACNHTDGGEGASGIIITNDTKKKISDSLKGRDVSYLQNQEIKDKISNSLKNYYKTNKNNRLGSKHSVETKSIISNKLNNYYSSHRKISNEIKEKIYELKLSGMQFKNIVYEIYKIFNINITKQYCGKIFNDLAKSKKLELEFDTSHPNSLLSKKLRLEAIEYIRILLLQNLKFTDIAIKVSEKFNIDADDRYCCQLYYKANKDIVRKQLSNDLLKKVISTVLNLRTLGLKYREISLKLKELFDIDVSVDYCNNIYLKYKNYVK
jgi:hypothetical protein